MSRAASIPDLGMYGHSKPSRGAGDGENLQRQSKIYSSLKDSWARRMNWNPIIPTTPKRLFSQIILPTPPYQICQHFAIGKGLAQGILQCGCFYPHTIPYAPHLPQSLFSAIFLNKGTNRDHSIFVTKGLINKYPDIHTCPF